MENFWLIFLIFFVFLFVGCFISGIVWHKKGFEEAKKKFKGKPFWNIPRNYAYQVISKNFHPNFFKTPEVIMVLLKRNSKGEEEVITLKIQEIFLRIGENKIDGDLSSIPLYFCVEGNYFKGNEYYLSLKKIPDQEYLDYGKRRI